MPKWKNVYLLKCYMLNFLYPYSFYSSREIVGYSREIKLLSDNLAYAWKPMQFSQGAVYLYTDTNMSCKFKTYRVYLYTDIGRLQLKRSGT